MALSMPFKGSGEFVPVREWTCSHHSYPQTHDCDCEHCDREWNCEECSTSEWLDTGEMRELSGMEIMVRDHAMKMFSTPSVIHGRMIEWNEDEKIPLVESRGD